MKLKELNIHLIVARGIEGMGALWFIFNLLILTFIFFITSFLFKKQFLFTFQIMSLFSYIIQYTGINFRFFRQYTSKIWMSVGNLVETLPIAIGAFSFSSNNLFLLLKKRNPKIVYFCVFFFFLTSNFHVFAFLNGQASPGLKPLFNSILLFTIFYVLPFENLSSKILDIINIITKYTQGIYCLHSVSLLYMNKFIDKKRTFIGSIFLYILTYFISFIGFKLSEKTKLKYLFI